MSNTAKTPLPSQARGYAIALTGTVVWSTAGIFVRALTDRHVPSLVLAFWRDGLVAVALFITLAIIRPSLLRLPRRQLSFLLLYGLVLAGFNATWTISVALTGAAVSTVLIYSSPAITALLGWWRWREAPGPVQIIAILLSLSGCMFVSGAYSSELWNLNPAGIVIGMSSGLMFAAYSIFGKEASHRGVNPWSALMVTFSFAAIFLILLLQVPLEKWLPELSNIGRGSDVFWTGRDAVSWGLLILLAWGPTIGGYGLYNVSLNYLPASVANLIASLEPTMTAGLAYILLGERLTIEQLAGSVMIISGVTLLQVGPLNRLDAVVEY